jgi:hypothetical protein
VSGKYPRLRWEGEEPIRDGAVQGLLVTVGDVGPADRIEKKGVPGEERLPRLAVETDAARAVPGGVEHREVSFGDYFPVRDKHLRIGNLHPETAKRLHPRFPEGFEDLAVGLSGGGAEKGAILLVDDDGDVMTPPRVVIDDLPGC